MRWYSHAPGALPFKLIRNSNWQVLSPICRTELYLSRSSFEQEPMGPIVGGWQLRSANGRIGGIFYATSILPQGTERRMCEWIETDLQGNIVRRVDLPRKTIQAFSSDGSLYARGYEGGYTVLNPALNSWRTISASANEVLLGADDNSLVVLIRGTNQVVWSPVESASSSTLEVSDSATYRTLRFGN
jgi:hypothetical protein